MPRYAAIDIGSNSIRMMAAETSPGTPARILAQDRQVTRLGDSVFRTGVLSDDAISLACEVLARMAEEYKRLDVVAVRAVATAAVRDTRNQDVFLERASRALGAPVEIIPGREEARLIHLGVQSRWPQPGKRVLITDIGGGSAELVAADDCRMRDAISKQLGAVRLRTLFLDSDPPAPQQLHRMRGYIAERLAGVPARFGVASWDRAIGTSATAAAVVCAVNRIPRTRRDEADRHRASTAQIRKLYEKLGTMPLAERRKVTGIGPSRAEIIVAGTAVLLSVLEAFGLPSVYFSVAGVRDGIIADLAARGVGGELSGLSPEQRKEVENLARKYGVALAHARKVAELAHSLFDSLHPLHGLAPGYGKLLQASAFLHDIGHYVNDAGHHKHSYYLVANSDLSGFTARERELIANLCRYHRKAMPSAAHPNFQSLSPEERRVLLLLAPLLRLADNLDRGHEQRIRGVECQVRNGQVVMRLASADDIDLEQWAAERAGEVFHQVYGTPIVLEKGRA
ncbi:MAG TPA: Ppx/GppA phosphatase family protein [Bryobacteraceae bacterium]|nr:Ppx/GppA phosphatase family protein [Bryobacteraceae bacterium]